MSKGDLVTGFHDISTSELDQKIEAFMEQFSTNAGVHDIIVLSAQPGVALQAPQLLNAVCAMALVHIEKRRRDIAGLNAGIGDKNGT